MKKLTYYGATTLTLLSIGLLSNGYQADAKQQTTVKMYHFHKSHHKYKISKPKNVKYSGKANLGKSIKYNGKNYYYLSKIKGYISLNDFNKINDRYTKQQKKKAAKATADALEDSKSTETESPTDTSADKSTTTSTPATTNQNSTSNPSTNSNYTLSSTDDGYNEEYGITNSTNYYNTLKKAMFDRINQYRNFKGLASLKSNDSLNSLAYLRANYIARTNNLDSSADHEDSDIGKLAVRFGLASDEDNAGIAESSISNPINEIINPITLGNKIIDENFTFSDDQSIFDSSNQNIGIGVSFNYIVSPEDGNAVVFLLN